LRVLVTGGAGYVGSILCETLLTAGHRVTVLDNLMYGQHSLLPLCAHPAFDFVRGDARDEATLRPLVAAADALIPLAAIVGAPACDADPILARSVNLEAVLRLDRLRSPRQLVVFPTTNSGYGAKSGAVQCTEETPLEPISLYGRTKADAEAALLQRPNVVTLRLATVFGLSPRMRLDLLVNDFVHRAVTEGCIVIFEQDFKRNVIHIRDVADGMAYCLENGARLAGRCYNLGLDEGNLSKGELAEKIRQQVPSLSILYSAIGSDPDRRNYVVSSQRLREAGFWARRPLEDGIRELIKGCRMLARRPFGNV
jgi:nucleoside-diphosphate-sugar epimerase